VVLSKVRTGTNWLPTFPNLLSYNRFVETMPELLVPLAAFMQSRCGSSQGIAFIDSTPLVRRGIESERVFLCAPSI
jgi:hypothetical protein